MKNGKGARHMSTKPANKPEHDDDADDRPTWKISDDRIKNAGREGRAVAEKLLRDLDKQIGEEQK
jgi:hypothetical protein